MFSSSDHTLNADLASTLPFEAVDGGKFAPVIIHDDGSVSPTSMPNGWSLVSTNTSIGGILVVIEEVHAPAPDNFGFAVAPDEFDVNGAPYQAQGIGGITISIDDILAFTQRDPFGVIAVIDETLVPTYTNSDYGGVVWVEEEIYSYVAGDTGGTSIIVVLDDTEYGAVFVTGDYHGEPVIHDEILSDASPHLIFWGLGNDNNPVQETKVYLEDCGNGQYQMPVL